MVRSLAQPEEARGELSTAVPLPAVKGGVFRRGKSPAEQSRDTGQVEAPDRGRLEPKAGKSTGTQDSIGIGFQGLESFRSQSVPDEFLPARNCNDVFANAHPLIQPFLDTEVAGTAGNGNFYDEFGNAGPVSNVIEAVTRECKVLTDFRLP